MAKTLFDVVNAPKSAEVALEKCIIVKNNDDGTYNIVCEINGNKTYVNFVHANLCKDNKLYVKFGKKEDSWKKERWFQTEAPTDEKETEEEDK